MSRAAVATINLGALEHNLTIARQAAPNCKIIAVIKANAYGHGLIPVANALAGVDAFAVAHFEEAIALRKQFADKHILLLQGYADEIELALLLSQHIQPVVHSIEQVALLEKIGNKHPDDSFVVWLKLNTGMNRLGLSADEFDECWARLNAIPCLQNNIGIMSHFANADVVEHPGNEQQLQLFSSATSSMKAEKSMANSAAILSMKNSHYHWVRPGIMLYGASPFVDRKAVDDGLRPVMNLRARIIAVNKIKKGQAVGYGSSWQAGNDTLIAVVGIGYGDGYPRHVAENTPVLIQGRRYPIVGRVSMDMICVDLGQQTTIKTGDEVLLWGDNLPIEEIAEKASTISYELLCQITPRVKMVYQDK